MIGHELIIKKSRNGESAFIILYLSQCLRLSLLIYFKFHLNSPVSILSNLQVDLFNFLFNIFPCILRVIKINTSKTELLMSLCFKSTPYVPNLSNGITNPHWFTLPTYKALLTDLYFLTNYGLSTSVIGLHFKPYEILPLLTTSTATALTRAAINFHPTYFRSPLIHFVLSPAAPKESIPTRQHGDLSSFRSLSRSPIQSNSSHF